MSRPKVSVVIPSYNRADYIPATINSILKQSFKDFELIFIDDGSTDNTAEIMEHYVNRDLRVKYFKQPNSERAVARSFGMNLAVGDYICLVDSDDTWYPEKLAKQVEIMDADKDIAFCFASVNRMDMNGKRLKAAPRQHDAESGFVFFDLLMRNFIPSVTPMFRRKLYNKVGEQVSEFIPYEDWDFWLKLSRLGKFYHIKEPLGNYRLHPGQSVQNVNPEKIEEVTIKVLKNNTTREHLERCLNSDQNLDGAYRFVNEAYSLAYLRIAYWYILADKRGIARDRLQKSMRFSDKRMFDYRWWGLFFASFLSYIAPGIVKEILGSFH